MSNVQPILLDTSLRDPDLVEKVAAAGSLFRDMVYKSCLTEQQRRDALKAMPSVQRRRSSVRHALQDQDKVKRDDLRHIHSVLAHCTLPYDRPAADIREWNKKQGRMQLSVTAGKLLSPDGQWIDQPLPWGTRARLILIHLCSEAIRNKSPDIQVEDSLSGFIKSMGFTVTGGKNGTLAAFKEQINALAACSMRIGLFDGNRAKTVNTQPFSSLDVWLSPEPDHHLMWPSTISFSKEFYDTLKKHAIPVNTHALRAFSNSARKIDLIIWIGYRIFNIERPVLMSWDALCSQWGENYARFSNFRRDFHKDIMLIKEVFPKLPIKFDDLGCTFSPGSTEALAIPLKTRK